MNFLSYELPQPSVIYLIELIFASVTISCPTIVLHLYLGLEYTQCGYSIMQCLKKVCSDAADPPQSNALEETLLNLHRAQATTTGVQFKTLNDETLAYSFSYPVSAGSEKLGVILSRRPERYSSAAPLAPDARQRIVSELVDFSHGIVISTTVSAFATHKFCT